MAYCQTGAFLAGAHKYNKDNYHHDIIYYEPSPLSPPAPLAKPGHFEAGVFFAIINDSATDKATTIGIKTPWTLTYHNRIKERLIKEVGLKSVAKPDSYYWRELGTVSVPEVEWGEIKYWNKELLPNSSHTGDREYLGP